jgi:hypothetical protein
MFVEPNLPETSAGVIRQAPFHVLSALITVVLDWVWLLLELPETMSVVGLAALLPTAIVLGLTCMVGVTLIQRFVAGDSWGTSVAKGFMMGVLAGVPYPVVGTVVGVPLLAWAGINEVQKALPARRSD